MSELRATGVTKRFRMGERELCVLNGADLCVPAGESVAILGVSGSGKSTLLHILGGLERPSAGSVVYRGGSAPEGGDPAGEIDMYALELDARARFRNRELGFVFQLHHLLPEFDAEENVMMPCLLAGWSRARARERARELLDEVGLDDRREHRPGKLSGGERQRVAIARALAMSPRIVFADEPTGNLDPQTAGHVEDLFLRLNRESATSLVLVTHNEKLANRLDKKCYLIGGRLES